MAKSTVANLNLVSPMESVHLKDVAEQLAQKLALVTWIEEARRILQDIEDASVRNPELKAQLRESLTAFAVDWSDSAQDGLYGLLYDMQSLAYDLRNGLGTSAEG